MSFSKLKTSFTAISAWALLLGGAFLMTACGDDDGGPSGPSGPSVTITAELTTPAGQSDWSMPMGQIVITENMPPLGASITSFNAFNEAGQSLVIAFDSLAITTYAFSGVYVEGAPILMTYQAEVDSFALSTAGVAELPNGTQQPFAQIVITEINTQAKVASGTFTGLVANPIDPTNWAIFQNGVFTNVPYINSDDINPPDGGFDGDSYLNASVNGSAFTSVSALGISSNNPILPTVAVTGTSADGTILGFTFSMLFTDLEATTYEIGQLGDPLVGTYSPQGNVLLQQSSNSGTLTITSINPSTKVIEGTFNMETTPFGFNEGDDSSITNGEFRVQVL